MHTPIITTIEPAGPGVLPQELLDGGTRVIVRGQSAASRGFAPSELADGVELALSTIHDARLRRAPAGWPPRKSLVTDYLQAR